MLGAPASRAPTSPGTRTQDADSTARIAELTAISSRTGMPDETALILAKINEFTELKIGMKTSAATTKLHCAGTA